MQFSGLSLVDPVKNIFEQRGSAQVRFVATLSDCTYAKVTTDWRLDGTTDPKYSSSLSFPLELSTLAAKTLHSVTATVTFFDVDEKKLATLRSNAVFTINALPLAAKIASADKTIPISLDMVVDASASYDSADPCYVTSYLGSSDLKRCLSANSLSRYNTTGIPMTFTFRCRNEATEGPCKFKNGAWKPEPTEEANDQVFITSSPLLTIPSSSLAEGTYLWSVQVSRDTRSAASDSRAKIKVIDSRTYIVMEKLEVQGASVDTTYVGNSPVVLQGKVKTNAKQTTYIWKLALATGAVVDMKDTAKFVSRGTTLR